MSNLGYSDQQFGRIIKHDLQQSHAPIERAIEQADYAVEQAIETRRNSFLQQLFPNKASRAIIEGELAVIKSEFEFRKRALHKVRETQIQSLTEVCNQYLVRQKAEIRANTAQFLMHKNMELQKEMDQILDDFITQMDKQMQKIESISNPKLRKIRETQLDRDIDGFMQQQQILIEKFRRIIFEEV